MFPLKNTHGMITPFMEIWLVVYHSMAIIWLIYGYYMVIIWLMMVNDNLVGGIPTPLKNDGVKVSWDDDMPNISQYNMEK